MEIVDPEVEVPFVLARPGDGMEAAPRNLSATWFWSVTTVLLTPEIRPGWPVPAEFLEGEAACAAA